jgi:phosphoglycolate phosphatase
MNFNYKHIIWDWNGTLVDDAWLCLEIINNLLHKRNIPKLNLREYQEVFDFPVKDFYAKIGFDFSKEPFHVPASEYIDAYNKERSRCGLHRGALEALSFFRDSGISQSILSASKQSSLEEAIEYYTIKSYFTNVCGLDDYYANGKIEIAKNLLAHIGENESTIVIIGDTTHDYEVARSLGIDCILFNGGHHSRKKLEQCGVRVLDTLADIKHSAIISV